MHFFWLKHEKSNIKVYIWMKEELENIKKVYNGNVSQKKI